MTRDFVPKNFLRHVTGPLLEQYCRTLECGLDINSKDIDNIYISWQNLPKEKRDSIERDFREVNDLSTEAGVMTLIGYAQYQGIDFTEELDRINGFQAKALWVFLNHPDIFKSASVWYVVEHIMSGWREITDLQAIDFQPDDSTRRSLESALSDFYFRTEGRGRKCQVEIYVKEDRILFCGYPEDYAATDLSYDDTGILTRRVRKPVFDVYLLFYPKQGRLKVKARGGKDKVKALQKIFTEIALQRKFSFDNRKERIFELKGLKQRYFPFPTDPVDQIEDVTVKRLQLSWPDRSKRRIIVEAETTDQVYDILDLLDIPLKDLHVTQALLRAKFPGKGNKGKVTFRLTWPNLCDLGESERHIKLRNYLKRWGIDCG